MEQPVEQLAGVIPVANPFETPVGTNETVSRTHPFSFSGGTFATVAKALLAFAGAYLLRAVAESGTIPQAIGIFAGLLYAIAWLVWSTRLPSQDRFAITLYGLTSTFIFSGLVWENSIQFHVLPFPFAAALIVMFSYTGTYMSWRRSLPQIAAVLSVVSSSLGSCPSGCFA